MNDTLEKEVHELHAQLCGALADTKRILILYALAERPHAVLELASAIGATQSATSRHLKVLRDRGLVSTTRLGTTIEYSLADERLIQALDLLRSVLRDNLSRRAELVEAIPKASSL